MPQPAKKKPAQKPVVAQQRNVIYPHLEIRICDSAPTVGSQENIAQVEALMDKLGVITSDLIRRPPITEEKVVDLFGWTTESEHVAAFRKAHDIPKEVTEAEIVCERCGRKEKRKLGFCKCLPTFRDCNHEFVDEGGKVVGEPCCMMHNVHNRPFDRKWALLIAHEILSGYWAGPGNGMRTINPTTSLTVGETGINLDGQHKGAGLKFACQLLRADPDKWPRWQGKMPVLECLWIFGSSEEKNVVGTMDYTKPRTDADNTYGTEFERAPWASPGKPMMTPSERREAAKLLQSATQVVWERTRHPGYQTPRDLVTFREGHPRIAECVHYLFHLNHPEQGRPLSHLGLPHGKMSGIMFLQAASSSDIRAYLDHEPREEKHLKFENLGKAKEFWVCLANSELKEGRVDDKLRKDTVKSLHVTHERAEEMLLNFAVLRDALAGLVNPDTNEKPSQFRVNQVLARAWTALMAGEPFTWKSHGAHGKGNLALVTHDGKLDELIDFGGVDRGDDPPKDDAVEDEGPDKEEQARLDKERLDKEQRELSETTLSQRMEASQQKKAAEPPKPSAPNGAPKLAPKQAKAQPTATPPSIIDQYRELKASASMNGHLLLIRSPRNGFAYDADAEQLAKLLKLAPKKDDKGVTRVDFPVTQFAVQTRRLRELKKKFRIADETQGVLQLLPES